MFDLSDLWMFVGTFLALVAAGIGFPIPEEVPVITAGIWAAHSQLGPFRWLILLVCIAGILISDVMLYSIGRFGGARLMQHRWIAKLMPPEKRERIESNFAHYGMKVLLVIRWLPGIRSPMFITAGMMRVPLWRFVLADGIAAVMGHTLLFFLAFWFGDQFRDLFDHAAVELRSKIRPILILTGLLAIGGFFMVRYLRRPVTTADPKELPLIGEKVAAGIESLDSKVSFLGLGKDQGSEVRDQGSGVRGQESGTSDGRLCPGEHATADGMEKARQPSTDRE